MAAKPVRWNLSCRRMDALEKRLQVRWSALSSRFVNGVIAAAITVLFLAHGALGGFSALTGYTSPFTWLIWGGVILIGAHVVASIVTSIQQLTDVEFPPSARKKRHLALKWATGGLLAVAACAHIVLPKNSLTATLVVMAVIVLLAVHLCVGSKSLLKDIGIDRRYKTAFRVVVIVLSVLFALAMLIGGA